MNAHRKMGDRYLPYLLLAAFFVVSVIARPLLPVDETRYLSVAWEMYARHSFLVPTLNFEPYFQKPPLLFWLIEAAWSIFGVSRAAAVAVIFGISSTVIYLTQRLAKSLFPQEYGIAERSQWLVLGSAIFVIYSSLILFDMLLTVFVLATFLALVGFARGRGAKFAILAGLSVGFGVLSKGPVMLIHVACPIVMYPLWRNPATDLSSRRLFAAVPLLIASALVPVLAWLSPALYQSGGDFAYKLVWQQAAGRVSGSMNGAHARPFYFYLLVLPVGLMPWILSIDLWRSRLWQRVWRDAATRPQNYRIVRFLGLWLVALLLVFSLISGKQPHYLVPLLPPIILLFAYMFSSVPSGLLRNATVMILTMTGIGQAVASMIIFPRYDLGPLAEFVGANRGADWAFVDNYQGEVTFLARLEHPLAVIKTANLGEWLDAHPRSYAIVPPRAARGGVRRFPCGENTSNCRFVVIVGDDRASNK